MKARERVLKTINHEEPDRIPIDFGGMEWSIVDAPNMPEHNYFKLCEYLGIKDPEPPRRGPLMNEVQNVDERLLERFGVDTRYIYPGGIPLKEVEPGVKQGSMGIRYKSIGHYNDPDKYLWRDLKTVEEIENCPFWPDPNAPINVEGIRERAKYLHEKTDYAVGIHFGAIADILTFCFGMDKWLMNMKVNPKVHYAFINKYLDVTDKSAAKILTAVGEYLDIAVFASDLGTQKSLLISHKDYCHFIKPYEARLVQRAKCYTDAKIICHSCGSVWNVIKDRVEFGVDVQNPIQPLATNMNAEFLKKNFGDMVCFHGGIDIQHLLPFGNPKTIREEIKRLICVLGPGGGWIAATSHNINPDTRPENIVAMFDTLLEFGAYPIQTS